MSDHRLPKRALFSIPPSELRKSVGGQRMTWSKELKRIAKGLSTVGSTRLPGWARETHLRVRFEPQAMVHMLSIFSRYV